MSLFCPSLVGFFVFMGCSSLSSFCIFNGLCLMSPLEMVFSQSMCSLFVVLSDTHTLFSLILHNLLIFCFHCLDFWSLIEEISVKYVAVECSLKSGASISHLLPESGTIMEEGAEV